LTKLIKETETPSTKKPSTPMKTILQRLFPAALALLFAGMLPAAETSLSNGTLTIDFNEDYQWVKVSNTGMTLILESNKTITGAGSSFQVGSVNRIVVTDSENFEGQSLSFEPGTEITLSGGLLVTGVEQVYFYNAVTSTGLSGIEVVARQNILVDDNLTGGDGGISLTGQGVDYYGEYGDLVLVTGADITSTGSISLTGTGGSGGNDKNGVYYLRGVSLYNSKVETTGSASITMIGNGGDGYYYYIEGIVIESSKVTAEDGNIVIHGTGGNSWSDTWGPGVTNSESTIKTTGSGDISITGVGRVGGQVSGVFSAGEIVSVNGNISVTGTGGVGRSAAGILVAGNIVSANGNIMLMGEGGTGSYMTSGIWLAGEIVSTNGNIVMIGKGGIFEVAGPTKNWSDLLYGGINLYKAHIEAKGTASISMTGTGGEGPSNYLTGVGITSSEITAENGNISITGTGGEPENGFFDDSGVRNVESTIKTTGSGNIEITGTAGSGSDENYGISIGGDPLGGNKSGGQEISALTATGSGDITLTGTPGEYAAATSGVQLGLFGHALIEQTGAGQIEIIADQILIHESNATITAENNTVILRPLTEDWPITLGVVERSLHLVLTNNELDRITAGKLIIGSSDAGTITISEDIALKSSTNTELHSGGDIIFEDGGFNTGGGTLLLSPGTSPKAVRPVFSGTDVSAGTLSFASSLAIVINGTMPGDGAVNTYTRLTVDGNIDLTGVELDISGSHDPSPDESFTIVEVLNVGNITGTFNGLPEGGLIDDFLGSGRGAFITYTGGDGNDVVIMTCTHPTSGGTIEATQTICYGSSPETFTNVTLPAGHLGHLEYQWQLSTSTPTATWIDVGTVTTTADYHHIDAVTQNTWFRRLAKVTCDPVDWDLAVASNVVEVIVRPQFTPGEIASDGETICYNTSASEIGSTTPASGGNGIITYSWKSSADDFTAAIDGAEAATYTPGTLTQTTSYRRYANDGTCNTEPELSVGTWTVTVRDDFTPGAIQTTGETICYNTAASEIGSQTPASGGDGIITYSWKSSADDFTAAIDGAEAATFTPGTLTQTTSYRRYAKDATCITTPEESVGTWTVTVRDAFTAGAIATTGETICYNTPASEIGSETPASGGDGIITYSWRSSSDGFIAPIDGADQSTYTPGTLTQTTAFRRYANDGTCISDPVVSAGTWTVTVVDQPVAPEITKNPTDATVCEGTSLTVDTTPGSGGAGTSTDQYRYSTDGGLNWSSWESSVPQFNAVPGTNLIQSRRISDVVGCATASFNEVSWTVEPEAIAGVLTPFPLCPLVFQGMNVSATLSGSSGGNGTDKLEYRTKNGSSWSSWQSYASGQAISTTGLTAVEIQNKRLTDFCDDSGIVSVSWVVGDTRVRNITKLWEYFTVSEALADPILEAGDEILIRLGTHTDTFSTNGKGGLSFFFGESICPVTINGSATFSADDILNIRVSDIGNNILTVNNTLSLNSATLKVIIDGNAPPVGSGYVIFSSPTIDGNFSNPALIEVDNNRFVIVYDQTSKSNHSVILTTVRRLFRLEIIRAGQR